MTTNESEESRERRYKAQIYALKLDLNCLACLTPTPSRQKGIDAIKARIAELEAAAEAPYVPQIKTAVSQE